MKIGVDIMGGDYAPETTVEGTIAARQQLDPSVELVLYGHKDIILEVAQKKGYDLSGMEIVDCQENIHMGEHPSKAYSKKPDSSIVCGFEALREKKIDGFTSAGNTGAMLVGAMYTVKSISGIIRPSIVATLPKLNGKWTIVLDVGINPDSRPDVLFQYGILGSIYAEQIFHYKNPRVGLLNIGSEEQKGNLLTKNTYEQMRDNERFNFIGNVEGNDLFHDEKADVIICDGFVGNVVLKQAEAFYSLVKERKIHDEFFERFNFVNYGGTPILGIDGNVVIGHGISNTEAIKNMIIQTKGVIEARLSEKIKDAFN